MMGNNGLRLELTKPGHQVKVRFTPERGRMVPDGDCLVARLKKCEGSGKSNESAACEAKAVGKDGKPLAGAAKTSFMKKCEAAAGK